VSQMFLQPFLTYNTKTRWTFTLQSETTASYQFGFGLFAAHPEIGPTWKIRSAIVILLPRRR
jgi:hypothetical protein